MTDQQDTNSKVGTVPGESLKDGAETKIRRRRGRMSSAMAH
jgi:hypothetical protein